MNTVDRWVISNIKDERSGYVIPTCIGQRVRAFSSLPHDYENVFYCYIDDVPYVAFKCVFTTSLHLKFKIINNWLYVETSSIRTKGVSNLPVYLSSTFKISILGLSNSVKITYKVVFISKSVNSYGNAHFVMFHDILEDRFRCFQTCINMLMSSTVPTFIKSNIIRQMANYNIKHGKNICRIDLTDYFDGDGKQLKPLPDEVSLNYRTVFDLISCYMNISHFIMTMRAIKDINFKRSFNHFMFLQSQ